jgi:hypothetical protein
MARGIPLNLAGDIASEVVRQATDDAGDRGQVTGGQTADGEHDIIVRLLNPAGGAIPPDSPAPGLV